MATSTQSRTFQAFNNRNYKARTSSIKKSPRTSNDEPVVFGRIPYSVIRTSGEAVPSSPGSPIKSTSETKKRNSSTISLGNLLPRRKSLQTTALSARRQSLWMNISKNAPPTNDVRPSILLLRQEHSSLMRKKFLRILLVFSYLLSISLLAIALTTFYGFFWSGYTTPQTTSVSDVTVTVRSLISLTSNSTFVDPGSKIEDVI
jgi:hypothetical protein